MRPLLVLIAAHSRNGVIGKAGGLPWRLRDDLRLFRRLTMGQTLLMGRKTYQSLPGPLAGRRLWVLTRQPDFTSAHARAFSSLDEALQAARQAGLPALYVIGGGELYRQTLPLADELMISKVLAAVSGDTYFPPYDPTAWLLRFERYYPARARNPLPFVFRRYIRRHHIRNSS